MVRYCAVWDVHYFGPVHADGNFAEANTKVILQVEPPSVHTFFWNSTPVNTGAHNPFSSLSIIPHLMNEFIQFFNTGTINSKICISQTRMLLQTSLLTLYKAVFHAIYSFENCQVWHKILWAQWIQHRKFLS